MEEVTDTARIGRIINNFKVLAHSMNSICRKEIFDFGTFQ